MLTGVAILTIMMVGVKGGMKDKVVARLPVGFCMIGMIRNKGKMIGSIAGNCIF